MKLCEELYNCAVNYYGTLVTQATFESSVGEAFDKVKAVYGEYIAKMVVKLAYINAQA